MKDWQEINRKKREAKQNGDSAKGAGADTKAHGQPNAGSNSGDKKKDK